MNRFEQLKQLLTEEPTDNFLNYALALEYAKQNELIVAINLIENVLNRDGNYLGAYLQLGELYEKTDQPKKAQITYKKGIVIAQLQGNKKAQGELTTAAELLDDE